MQICTQVFCCVSLQSTKRTLRSNEIILPPGKLLETGLDLSFALQVKFLKLDQTFYINVCKTFDFSFLTLTKVSMYCQVKGNLKCGTLRW